LGSGGLLINGVKLAYLMMKYLYKIWRFCLPAFFLVVLVHLLKDITQDIFKIPTFLDFFGNVNEDLLVFSPLIRQVIAGFGFISFGVEVFLVVAIPKVIMNKKNSKLERYAVLALLFLVIYFISVTLMDPRF
jgi:hypothetical protein